jgi:malate/lactate dehydrogenase
LSLSSAKLHPRSKSLGTNTPLSLTVGNPEKPKCILADVFLGVQFGGDEVVKAKDGAGSATLSMAFAGFRSDPQLAWKSGT